MTPDERYEYNVKIEYAIELAQEITALLAKEKVSRPVGLAAATLVIAIGAEDFSDEQFEEILRMVDCDLKFFRQKLKNLAKKGESDE